MSLLSTLEKSNSGRNLMNEVDDDDDDVVDGSEISESYGSDAYMIFFQPEANPAPKQRRRMSLLSSMKKSSSTSNLMDDVSESPGSNDDLKYFHLAHGESTNNTAETPRGRGVRKVGSLVQTVKRSISKSRLDGDSDGSDDDLRHIQNLEDIERSIPYTTPRSEKKKLRLRARLKAREGKNTCGVAAESGKGARSASKSPSRLSEENANDDPERLKRKMMGKAARGKSPARFVEDSAADDPQRRERRVNNEKSSRRLSKFPGRLLENFV